MCIRDSYVYRPDRNYGILRVKVQYNDGSPAVGVQVNLTTQGDSLVTPADGIVQFAPSPGAHTVVAKQYGLYDQSASKLVSAGQHVDVILVVRARPTVNFSGTVRNAATGNPLADAEVILSAPQLSPAHSDASGHYSLGSVYANTYHLHVGRPGFMPIDTDVTIDQAFPGQDFQLVPAPTYDCLLYTSDAADERSSV